MKKHLIYSIFSFITFFSCVSKKDLIQLRDIKDGEVIKFDSTAYTLKKGDLIDIKITSIDESSVSVFNKKVGQSPNDYYSDAALYVRSYKVNQEGNVILPIIGEVNLEGLTLDESYFKLKEELSVYYNFFEVSVKLVGFQFSTLGELAVPGQFSIYRTKFTILDAIAKSGGLTNYADTKNITLIRSKTGETRIINIQNKDFITKGMYVMEPGDIIYVPALKAKVFKTNTAPLQITISALTLIVLVLNILTR